MNSSNIIIITVEGNIGSGKTTLCQELEQVSFNKPHKVLYEEVSEWCKHSDENGKNIFELYYSDKKKYSYLFQSYVLCSRVAHILKNCDFSCKNIIICERSHLTDFYIFATNLYKLNLMSDIEYKIYQELFKTINISISGTIYNKANTSICIDRIKKRNRLGENITEEYIEQLNNAHDEWLLNKSNSNNLLIINGNIEKENIDERQKQINDIIVFINSIESKN
jgi:deoxyadenosine/deoxycytidine kinase